MTLKETVARSLEVPSYNCWPGLIAKLGKRTYAPTELVMQALQYPVPLMSPLIEDLPPHGLKKDD